MNKDPKFIVFEGIDGAGKTTQINLLCKALEKRGFSCFVTAEPTDMPSGKAIRRALAKEVDKTPLEMAEMFARDRELHNTDAKAGIEKMLADGTTVICDRYYYSSLAYQGTVLGYDTVAALNLDNPNIRRPDICIFLDLTPEKSLQRIGGRGEKTEIYENFDYLTRTRKTFFEIFDKLRQRGELISVIDADGDVEEVSTRILAAVADIFK
ncbi:MAG: dTMP kinase [Clostridia bacterium]|nr:dTMP kinase [Clostridia bacterium]MBR4032669.1 dTMP kinase [Clostridia bacterium]